MKIEIKKRDNELEIAFRIETLDCDNAFNDNKAIHTIMDYIDEISDELEVNDCDEEKFFADCDVFYMVIPYNNFNTIKRITSKLKGSFIQPVQPVIK